MATVRTNRAKMKAESAERKARNKATETHELFCCLFRLMIVFFCVLFPFNFCTLFSFEMNHKIKNIVFPVFAAAQSVESEMTAMKKANIYFLFARVYFFTDYPLSVEFSLFRFRPAP